MSFVPTHTWMIFLVWLALNFLLIDQRNGGQLLAGRPGANYYESAGKAACAGI
jgi:hypothetical protein